VLKKIFDFFLFSSLFISLCAVVMVYQTYQLLIYDEPSSTLLLFIFSSTFCSYNFHWWLTPTSVHSSERISWAQKHKGLHLFLYISGLIACIIFFFLLRQHWLAIAFGGLLTFLYSAPKLPQTFFKSLKKVAIGKTIFLSFVWMYVTTLLPLFASGTALNVKSILFAVSRFFLIYSICILFDYRDRDDDKKEGIRSMITYFNEQGIDRLFAISLIIFAATTIALHLFNFTITDIIMLLIPGIIVAILYPKAKASYSDYLFYFILDGLMMLSALLMLVRKI
jgi:4-hydroxybenzoate polyprenyltransferase